MKRSEWYKEEQKILVKSILPIEVKDFVQGILDRGLLTCGTAYDFKDNRTHYDLDDREEALVEQIYSNMVNRGFLSGEKNDEGMEKSELKILAYHMRKITLEKVAHDVMQEALNM